jgi:hypothetical protein
MFGSCQAIERRGDRVSLVEGLNAYSGIHHFVLFSVSFMEGRFVIVRSRRF